MTVLYPRRPPRRTHSLRSFREDGGGGGWGWGWGLAPIFS